MDTKCIIFMDEPEEKEPLKYEGDVELEKKELLKYEGDDKIEIRRFFTDEVPIIKFKPILTCNTIPYKPISGPHAYYDDGKYY